MKFARVTWLTLSRKGDPNQRFVMDIGDVHIDPVRRIEQGEAEVFLVVAEMPCPQPLKIDSDGVVELPEEPLQQAEEATEIYANVLSIGRKCRRSIASHGPGSALVMENDADRATLANARAISVGPGGRHEFVCDVEWTPGRMSSLTDRFDGAALLAEALAHHHPTGQMHELFRFFECAFRRPPDQAFGPLGKFLAKAGVGFTRAEVKGWFVQVRGRATHADLTRSPDFLLEAGVRGVIPRMMQAAYDVLFNKAKWACPDTTRRSIWRPYSPLMNAGGEPSFTSGVSCPIAIQMMDEFGSYPVNIAKHWDGAPENWWWCKWPWTSLRRGAPASGPEEQAERQSA